MGLRFDVVSTVPQRVMLLWACTCVHMRVTIHEKLVEVWGRVTRGPYAIPCVMRVAKKKKHPLAAHGAPTEKCDSRHQKEGCLVVEGIGHDGCCAAAWWRPRCRMRWVASLHSPVAPLPRAPVPAPAPRDAKTLRPSPMEGIGIFYVSGRARLQAVNIWYQCHAFNTPLNPATASF